MLTQCCPASTALTAIPAESCAQNFGQIQKVIFQRLYNGASRNTITAVTSGTVPAGDASLLASWTALKAATNGTKIVVSPFIENPADDGGDARTYGGGNETLNGIEQIIGSNPVGFSARLNGKTQDIIAAMKTLMCESLGNNLGVYLVNEKGQIEGLKIGTTTVQSGDTPPVDLTANVWAPIPIQRFFVSDKKHGNFDSPDYNDMTWAFAPGYSDQLDVLTLNASALTL